MATNPAVAADLTSRSLRPLTAAETAAAQVYLDDAWTQICTLRSSVPIRMDAGDMLLSALVVQIECAAVLRYYANPDGALEEHGDDYGRRFDSTVSSGTVYITDDELEQLGLGDGQSSNAFTITPVGTAPDPALRFPKLDLF